MINGYIEGIGINLQAYYCFEPSMCCSVLFVRCFGHANFVAFVVISASYCLMSVFLNLSLHWL